MRDSGTVIRIQDGYAQVRVSCLQPCRECGASGLCTGKADQDGVITALNPLQAEPGDSVGVEIPEGRYHRALIGLFGGLLGAALAGTAAGQGLAGTLGLDPSISAGLGLILGLAIAAPVLILALKKSARRLYPSIIEITRKGDPHG
jgi:positive regulator of sigma E activity